MNLLEVVQVGAFAREGTRIIPYDINQAFRGYLNGGAEMQ